MGIPAATHGAAASAVTGLGSWISLHTGAGAGTTGANEATGGGYARQQTTWPSSSGTMTGTSVNVPAAAGTYTEFGIWSAASGGTFIASQTFSGGNVIISGTGASVTVTPTVSA